METPDHIYEQAKHAIVRDALLKIEELMRDAGQCLAELRADALGLDRVTQRHADACANEVLGDISSFLGDTYPTIWQLGSEYLQDYLKETVK